MDHLDMDKDFTCASSFKLSLPRECRGKIFRSRRRNICEFSKFGPNRRIFRCTSRLKTERPDLLISETVYCESGQPTWTKRFECDDQVSDVKLGLEVDLDVKEYLIIWMNDSFAEYSLLVVKFSLPEP